MRTEIKARLRILELAQPDGEKDQAWADRLLRGLSIAYGNGEPFESVPAADLRKRIEAVLDKVYGPSLEPRRPITQTSKRTRRHK